MTTRSKIEQWIIPRVRTMSAYHVQDPVECIKLDAMENPYGWPASLVQEWLEQLRGVSLNRYPDPEARVLKRRLRDAMQVPDELELLLGNGSDELIQMIVLSVAEQGRTVLAPEPTFVMYQLLAELLGMQYVAVPLRGDDFGLDMPAMLQAIKQHRPAVVFLAYPNNPSGNLFDQDDIRQVIDAVDGLVIIDEAYAAFADETFINEPLHYDNLLVLRTMSKIGLAGLRLGYMIGAGAWLTELNKTRLPYNINVLTQLSVGFALDHRELMAEQAGRIREDRALLFEALGELNGVKPYPSAANFILFRVATGRASELFEALRNRGVLIKNLHPAGGMLRDCLRVTVGSAEENRAFLDALRAAL